MALIEYPRAIADVSFYGWIVEEYLCMLRLVEAANLHQRKVMFVRVSEQCNFHATLLQANYTTGRVFEEGRRYVVSPFTSSSK